jgi:hypothetical protein
MKNMYSSFLLLIIIDSGIAFSVVTKANFDGRQFTAKPRRMALTRRYSFFKDMFGQAFENDRNLSSDKSEGQYDAPGEEFEDTSSRNEPLTDTQKKWRQSQTGNDVTPKLITGSKWKLDLFLSGVPQRDPSNDLYGSKINISSRDKETGLSLPSTPSTSLTIELLENGVCRSSKSGFTSGENDGGWKLSDDGKMVRFSLDTLGYTRMVETKGSIQKIYWTKEEEKTLQTTSTYSIPSGFVYGDIEVVAGRQPGTFDLGSGGVLRVEKSTGLFGVSSKMVSCGKFEARINDLD